MTEFRFNFSSTELKTDRNESEDVIWLDSEEVIPEKQLKQVEELDWCNYTLLSYGETVLRHITSSKILADLKDEGIQNVLSLAEKSHSDLVKGKYEGGLKIWECTYDLLQYLTDNKDKINFDKNNVLDLGCGAGILGIYTYHNGANVTFQDYNKEVLENVTIPNALVNINEKERENDIKRFKFYSGDWANFNNILDKNEKFDFILSSETIYNESNYPKLIKLLRDRLNVDGIVFLAAKSVYFGVGGGVKQFEKALQDDGTLMSEICWKTDSHISRQILKITN